MMDIEKEINPNANKITVKDGVCYASIFDEEMDEIKLSFLGDGGVEIQTEGYDWISLSLNTLSLIQSLIVDAERYYESLDN